MDLGTRGAQGIDVIKPDGGSKDFAKAVLSKLSSLQPRPNGTEAPKLTAVYKFRCDVSEIARMLEG